MSDQNNVVELRNILFDTMRKLKDDENPMELERAKAIADVAQVVINSAKVEVDMVKHIDSRQKTQFFPSEVTTEKPSASYVHRVGDRSRQ